MRPSIFPSDVSTGAFENLLMPRSVGPCSSHQKGENEETRDETKRNEMNETSNETKNETAYRNGEAGGSDLIN